jgi:hypothetical protein
MPRLTTLAYRFALGWALILGMAAVATAQTLVAAGRWLAAHRPRLRAPADAREE